LSSPTKTDDLSRFFRDPSADAPGLWGSHVENNQQKEPSMGDRAFIIFTDGEEVSPVIYLHWAGSEVPAFLEQHKALMTSRGADVAYATARFVGIVHATMPDQNLSLGIWNADDCTRTAVKTRNADDLKQLSPGNAGFVVVDVQDYSWKAYGGYL